MGIGSANFIGVGNRGLSGIVYRIKVACRRSKQSGHGAWRGRFSKIATKFIKYLDRSDATNRSRWLNVVPIRLARHRA